MISRCLDLNCITFVHHILFNSCSAFLCVLPEHNLGILQYVRSCPKCYTHYARLPLSDSSFSWIVGVCCVLLAANTQTQELQIPSIVTFQTSHTTCLHWRQQQKFIDAVKLADKKLIACTSCSTWLHPQNRFASSTLLQMAQLLQCNPHPG